MRVISRTRTQLLRLSALVVALAAGCAAEESSTRSRLPALDVDWIDGLPAGLDTHSPRAVYLMHVPRPDVASTVDSAPFAEIAFATTDTGYEMHDLVTGPLAHEQGGWLRFGLVQDLGIADLGERYLIDEGAVSRVRVHGRLGNAWYAGESSNVTVRGDLSTGALTGNFRVTVASDDGPDRSIAARFSGQIERACASWVYRPDLDIGLDPPTGGGCGPVVDAIDAEATRTDGPELPPGFVAPDRTAAE